MSFYNRKGILLFAGLLLGWLPGQVSGQTAAKAPNVIVILADDLGWGDIGQPDSRIETPNLDRLAAGGVRLTHFYAGSSLCSPSRAALLTGRYPHSVGVPDLASPQVRGDVPILALDHDATTIPEALKPLGYRSMLAGKWHLGFFKENWPRKHGFDEYAGSLIGTPRYYEVGEVYHNEEKIDVCQYFTDWITDRSLDFMENNKDHPFFLYVAYNAPHYPLEAPAGLMAKYIRKFPNDGLYAIYAAMVEQMDWNIGRLLDKLDTLGMAENTLILFCSDNGPSAERASYGLPGAKISRGPLNGHKFSMYEGGIRIPFMARWPGRIPAGTVRDGIGSHMDILPTVLDAIQGKIVPEQVDGVSILPLLAGKPFDRQGPLYWENMYNMAVRLDQWKLIHQFWEDKPKLYDLNTDPREQNDLADQHPDIVKKLVGLHSQWLATHYPDRIPPQRTRPANRIPME